MFDNRVLAFQRLKGPFYIMFWPDGTAPLFEEIVTCEYMSECFSSFLSSPLFFSPCAVANLWDVSDRDIDRFATHLIKSFAENSDGTSLPLSAYMASARESCKLKWIIGAAPVVIGVPLMRAKME